MNFLDLKDISERTMELVNPTSPEKILKVGQASQSAVYAGPWCLRK